MNFLWPLAWGLGALALPIVALYLIRTRLQRKPVSTLLFWEHLTPQVYNHSLWRKLRRWVSLVLQLLFLLLLGLAIAQPLASWQTAKPAAVILILDTSVTMTALPIAMASSITRGPLGSSVSAIGSTTSEAAAISLRPSSGLRCGRI